MNNKPISFQIAEASGLFEENGKYLRPKKGSGVAQKFGHDTNHNRQAYVLPANKPEKTAFKCGGTEYPLAEFASTLGYHLEDFQNQKNSFSVKTPKKKTFFKNTQKTAPKPEELFKNKRNLISLNESDLAYWHNHGINPNYLEQYGCFVANINQRNGQPAFVFPIGDSYKFIFLDGERHTNTGGTHGLFPSISFDNGEEILLVEGIADCIKARELGFNSFTWSGGVQEQGKVGTCFEQRKFVVCLDLDDASKKALPKILEILSEQGHQVASVELPFLDQQEGKDLCDWFLLGHTKEEFEVLEKLNYKDEGPDEPLATQADVPLPLPKIHPIFTSYWSEFEGKTEAPMEYVLPSFLVSICTALGNRISLKTGINTLRPNIYMMLIGESTFMRKTTSLNCGLKTLKEMSDERKEAYYQAMQCFQNRLKEKSDGEELPTPPIDDSFIYPSDVTQEQMIVKLSGKPDGVFVYSELGAFLANMERSYSSGIKEMLTTLYESTDYARETKTSGCYFIKNPAPSLVGASTLQWLQAHLTDGELLSGFLARFCYVVKRIYPTIEIPFPKPIFLGAQWRKLFDELNSLQMELKPSEEAEASYSAWYSQFKEHIKKEDAFLHSPLGRLLDVCHKIAMVNHTLSLSNSRFHRDFKKEDTIEAVSYERAYPWIEFFAENVRRCYLDLTAKQSLTGLKILEIIRKRGKKVDGFITLARSRIMQFSHLTLKQFNEEIETLEAKNEVIKHPKGKRLFYSIKE